MQHTDKAIAEFEAWFSAEWRNRSPLMQGLADEQWSALFSDLTVKDDDGRYLNIVPRECFIAWLASRRELVVTLPPKISPHNTNDWGFIRPEAEEYDGAIDDCRAAIEAAGVTVRG